MDILLKNVPNEIVRKVDRLAKVERRSRTKEMISLIELALKIKG